MNNTIKTNEVKAEITRRGSSHKEIAQQLGVSEGHFSRVIHGEQTSRRIARWLENFASVEAGTFFPYVLEPPKRPGRPPIKPNSTGKL